MEAHLLSEMNVKELEDDAMYKFYPTRLHKEHDKPWYGPGRDLKIMIKHSEEYTNYLMWGK